MGRALATAVAMTLGGGVAQAAPLEGALRLVVGFPPGGGGDTLARAVGARLKSRHESVLVDNRPGAGSRIALDHVAHARNDGSVLIFAPDFALTIYPHIYKHMPYDPLTSFSPVALIAESVLALTVGPAVPAQVKTLEDYVRWVRETAKVAHYGTAGAGSLMDFAGKLLGRSAGIEVNHVAYKGGGPAIQDLVGGQLPAAITGVIEPREHVRAGKLRVLATSGPRRWRTYPEVPTFAESGYKDLVIVGWFALLAPAGTPAQTVADLNAEVNAALKSVEVIQTFQEFGLDAVASSPAGTVALIREDFNRWGRTIQSLAYVQEE